MPIGVLSSYFDKRVEDFPKLVTSDKRNLWIVTPDKKSGKSITCRQ